MLRAVCSVVAAAVFVGDGYCASRNDLFGLAPAAVSVLPPVGIRLPSPQDTLCCLVCCWLLLFVCGGCCYCCRRRRRCFVVCCRASFCATWSTSPSPTSPSPTCPKSTSRSMCILIQRRRPYLTYRCVSGCCCRPPRLCFVAPAVVVETRPGSPRQQDSMVASQPMPGKLELGNIHICRWTAALHGNRFLCWFAMSLAGGRVCFFHPLSFRLWF